MNNIRIAYAILAGMVLLFPGCHSKSGESKDANAEKSTTAAETTEYDQLPDNFYKRFTGNIGQYPITISLERKGNELSGSYYYHSTGKPIRISGLMNGEQAFSISEKDATEKITGMFDGSFTGSNKISGTWQNAARTKSYPFDLTETTSGFAIITSLKAERENCKYADKYKKTPREDGTYWDTVCSSIKINYLTVQAKNTAASEKINKDIIKRVCGNETNNSRLTSIEDLLRTVQSTSPEDGFNTEISVLVNTNENDILSLNFGNSNYYFGAAHGNYDAQAVNYNLKTGEIIELKEILVAGYKSKLDKIAAPLFYKEHGREGWEFTNGYFELNTNFAITPAGLEFSYNPYEIGPYMMGAPSVVIPYKSISLLIRPEGPLGVYR